MKKLIIGLGGCGNNIIKLLQDKIDDSFKTLSIQKDLQLLTISNADFKLNPKDNDFEEKLNTLLQYSNKVILVLGTAGTSSLLYFESLVGIFRKNRVKFDIVGLQPNTIEGSNKLEMSNKFLKKLQDKAIGIILFSNDDTEKADSAIIQKIKDSQ